MFPRLAALYLLLLHTRAQGFSILGEQLNHQEITKRAILNVTVQTCRALARAEGTDFTFPAQPFTAEGVTVACGAPKSTRSFSKAIKSITFRNTQMDIRHVFNAIYHFDDERFVDGRRVITEGILAVKASNKKGNFETARQNLGEILHPLQDFYSHSNWVEMGNKLPNSNLLKSDTSIGNIAEKSRATCRNCDGDDCRNNILEDVIRERILTSGYFSFVPFYATKPEGKCSHGGIFDLTRFKEPKGGINKDSPDASHGHLHTAAANMAIAATSELLEDIRRAAGDRPFLQMLGLHKGSSKALCFVIDKTSSMRDDIEAVKNSTSSIIDSEVGTDNEPSVYIFVSFGDPDFGPLVRTMDPNLFKSLIHSLEASGGGDEAEMSLSGLQLALSGAPFNSEIFLFTDAPAKDKHLKSTVIALIERTQTVVNFIISSSTGVNRRRRGEQQHNRIAASDAQLYRDLAQASGGQAIEVTKTELPAVIGIITEFSSSPLVTLLRAARSPGKEDRFSFLVDETVTNPTVYITGSSVTFTLISPTGESQSSNVDGPLMTVSLSVGNFMTLRLKKQTGLWEIKMSSTNPYTVRVVGQSSLDFLFDFVETSQGLFKGFDALDTRPRAGMNGSLLVSLTGSDTARVTEVTLVGSSGSEEIRGVVEPQGSGDFLVQVDRIPSEEFVVRVKGMDVTPRVSRVFQRQSSTNFRASNVTVTADSNNILVPGAPFTVNFSVMTNGPAGNYTIRATNNQRFDSTFPTSLLLETGSSTNGTVTLSAPLHTQSGTDVTLTIEAEAPGGEDENYVVLRFSVINSVTDFSHPVCQLLSLQSNCSGNCSAFMGALTVRVTDGDGGNGVDSVSLEEGNGTMNTSLEAGNEDVTLVSYSASCCSPEMQLQVVDRVGNEGFCSFTFREDSPAAISFSTKVTLSPLLFLSTVVLVLGSSDFMSVLQTPEAA